MIMVVILSAILIDRMNGMDVPVTDERVIRCLQARRFKVSNGYLRLDYHEIHRATKLLTLLFKRGSVDAMYMLSFMYMA